MRRRTATIYAASGAAPHDCTQPFARTDDPSPMTHPNDLLPRTSRRLGARADEGVERALVAQGLPHAIQVGASTHGAKDSPSQLRGMSRTASSSPRLRLTVSAGRLGELRETSRSGASRRLARERHLGSASPPSANVRPWRHAPTPRTKRSAIASFARLARDRDATRGNRADARERVTSMPGA
jgi:hypothetical protein